MKANLGRKKTAYKAENKAKEAKDTNRTASERSSEPASSARTVSTLRADQEEFEVGLGGMLGGTNCMASERSWEAAPIARSVSTLWADKEFEVGVCGGGVG